MRTRASATAVAGSSCTARDCARSTRNASVSVGPSVVSAARFSKSARTIRCWSLSTPAAIRVRMGPTTPNKRSAAYTAAPAMRVPAVKHYGAGGRALLPRLAGSPRWSRRRRRLVPSHRSGSPSLELCYDSSARATGPPGSSRDIASRGRRALVGRSSGGRCKGPGSASLRGQDLLRRHPEKAACRRASHSRRAERVDRPAHRRVGRRRPARAPCRRACRGRRPAR